MSDMFFFNCFGGYRYFNTIYITLKFIYSFVNNVCNFYLSTIISPKTTLHDHLVSTNLGSTISSVQPLFHVQLFAVGIHEFVLKVGEVLVGDDAYAEAVLELPFP